MRARHVPFTDPGAMANEVWNEVARPLRAAVLRAEFAAGPAVESFEAEWARFCGTEHAVGVASGTDALHLTLRALGVGPEDEVIVPSFSFVGAAEAVVLAGATPRFADVDPGTLLITGETLSEAVTARTKAAVVVHLYGQPANMDEVGATARSHGLLLVEDASHAHGARWGDRPVGSLADAAAFSFDAGAALGAFGDAGAVVTNDAALANRIRSLANHGRRTGSHLRHDQVGTGSVLDAIQAIVLREMLSRLDRWTRARQRTATRYAMGLADVPGVTPVACHPLAAHAYHRFVVRVPERDLTNAELARLGVQTSVEYAIPCHLQPAFSKYADGPLPHAEAAAAEVLSLPMFPHITPTQVDRVLLAVTTAMERAPVTPGVVAPSGKG
jgi:dTDP-4-amino-4,6-dideoxygalactose transaminase